MKCRHCDAEVSLQMIDLGFAPPSNSYLTTADLSRPEVYLPLRVKVCEQCWLVQTEDFAERDTFFNANYAYFSSTSTSWLQHARDFSQRIIPDLGLDRESFVVELASNDGYLLRNFMEAGIPCLGIEPTEDTAAKAEELGIPTLREFFGSELVDSLGDSYPKADLIIGNNVYAHVPDINDFTLGIKKLLAQSGTVTFEFPHLLNLVSECQFDTIYHEHYSYLSLKTVMRIFHTVGLRVFHVEKLSTHGGSLRVYGCHANDDREAEDSVFELVSEEDEFGLENEQAFLGFEDRAIDIRDNFVEFLIERRRRGELVVGYGAAAKGNTLLNYAGVKKDLFPAVFDAASSKQGMYLPGTHIPIVSPKLFRDFDPDIVVVLPWNLETEVRGVLQTILGKSAGIYSSNSRPRFFSFSDDD